MLNYLFGLVALYCSSLAKLPGMISGGFSLSQGHRKCMDGIPTKGLPSLNRELLSNHEKQRDAFHLQATRSWIVQQGNNLQWFPGLPVSMTGNTGERNSFSSIHPPSGQTQRSSQQP